jgi:hypothetical protein
MSQPLEELTINDFKFLNGDILKKLEIRFNKNSSEKLFAKAYFALPGATKRDDTMLAVYLSGKDMQVILKKLYEWYNNFYLATNAFSRLTAEAMNKVE